MNPGLQYLLRRQPIGTLRRLRRMTRTWQGLLRTLFVGGMLGGLIVLQLVSTILTTRFPTDNPISTEFSSLGPTFAPYFLLLMLASTIGQGGAIHLRPAELDWLLPAPVPRRQLVWFTILSRLRIQLASSVLLSVLLLSWMERWYAGFTSLCLFFLLVLLAGQLAGLVFARLGASIGGRASTLVAATAGLGSVVFVLFLTVSISDGDTLATAKALVEAPVIAQLGWITRPYVELFYVTTLSGWATWTAAAAVPPAVALLGLFRLDASYGEAMLARAKKSQQVLERMRGSGGALAAMGRTRRLFSLPHLPWLGGAGPIAWRQLIGVSRTPGVFIGAVLLSALGIGLPMVMVSTNFTDPDPEFTAGMGLALLVMLAPMLSQLMTFDFRSEVHRMAELRALPISSVAMATGQLAPPAILIGTLQLIGAVSIALYTGAIGPVLLGAYLVATWVFAYAMIGLENVIFLAFPYRLTPKDTAQVHFMGGVVTAMILKFIAMGVVLLPCAALAALAWVASSSAPLTLLVACLPAAVAAGICVLACAALYRRFDVARDIL